MKRLKEFDISFAGLKSGKYQFEYEIDNRFFEAFNYDDFVNSELKVSLEFIKKETLLELNFSAKGNVEVACDISNEYYNQPIEGDISIVVKFGIDYNDDNDELIILPYEEHQINVAQFIYEMIVLATPTKRIHPAVLDGTMQSETLEKLEKLHPDYKKKEDEIDPRWADLKKIITNKKI
ncbi:MAG: DUF177 domain-containing protein [Bacteroidota bacterium]